MPWYDFACKKCGREIKNVMRPISDRDGEPTEEEDSEHNSVCISDFEKCQFERKFEIPTYLPHVITNGHQRGFAKEALEQAKLEEAAIDEGNPVTRTEMEREASSITNIRVQPNK